MCLISIWDAYFATQLCTHTYTSLTHTYTHIHIHTSHTHTHTYTHTCTYKTYTQYNNSPRAFHLDCVNMNKVPSGDWVCPYCKAHKHNRNITHNNNNNNHIFDHFQSISTANMMRCFVPLDHMQMDKDTVDGFVVCVIVCFVCV